MTQTREIQEIKRTDKNKTNTFSLELFYFIIVFLFASRSSIFTCDLDPRSNPIGVILFTLPGFYLAAKNKILPNKSFSVIFLLLAIWTICQFLTSKPFKILEYVIFFLNLTISYVIVQIFREKIFYYFEQTTIALAAISLPLWVIMNIVGTTTIADFRFFEPASTTSLTSFLVFNIPNSLIYEDAGLFGLERNCGFCWEPGLFASFLIFAIFFNLCRKRNQFIHNPGLWILIVALFTTFSTTGYIAFGVLICVHFLYDIRIWKKKLNWIILPLFLFLGYQAYQLPFIKDKIESRSDEDSFVNDNFQKISTIEKLDKQITVDRFEGMLLEFTNYLDKPMLGYGLNRENSFVYKNISEKISISNGNISIFAKYGTILALSFLIAWICNSIYLRHLFRTKDKSFFLILLTLSISYSFMGLALFMALMFYSILIGHPTSFKKHELSKKEKLRKLILLIILKEKQNHLLKE